MASEAVGEGAWVDGDDRLDYSFGKDRLGGAELARVGCRVKSRRRKRKVVKERWKGHG